MRFDSPVYLLIPTPKVALKLISRDSDGGDGVRAHPLLTISDIHRGGAHTNLHSEEKQSVTHCEHADILYSPMRKGPRESGYDRES
jgi:hypothetical protein